MTSTRRYFVGTADTLVWPTQDEEVQQASSSILEMRYTRVSSPGIVSSYLDVIFRPHSGPVTSFYRYHHVPPEIWHALTAPRTPGTPSRGVQFHTLIKTQASTYPYTKEPIESLTSPGGADTLEEDLNQSVRNPRKPRFDFKKE